MPLARWSIRVHEPANEVHFYSPNRALFRSRVDTGRADNSLQRVWNELATSAESFPDGWSYAIPRTWRNKANDRRILVIQMPRQVLALEFHRQPIPKGLELFLKRLTKKEA